MSTDIGKIFNKATILQSLVISINDYEISKEDIASLEVKYDYFSFAVNGSLTFKDSVEISELGLWDGNTKIMLFAMDIYDESFTRFFRVTDVSSELYNDRHKSYTVNFVDTFYYDISNTYLSKSFNDTKSNAFKKYMDFYKWNTLISSDSPQVKLTINDTGDKENFIVPADRSVLDFFMNEFYLSGFKLYQGRNVINLQKKDLNSYEKNTDVYTNNTENDIYGFKIHDYNTSYNHIEDLNKLRPIEKNIKFDSNKIEDYTTKNLTDIYSSVELNTTKMDTLQHTNGKKLSTQEQLKTDRQKYDLEELYIRNNVLEMVVPGNFKYNEIGKIVDVELKGNPMLENTSLEGDSFGSGKYMITKINDRFVGDKLVQKLILNRIDFGKVKGK